MVKKLVLSGIIAAGAAGVMLTSAPAQAVELRPAGHGPRVAKQQPESQAEAGAAEREAAGAQEEDEGGADPRLAVNPYSKGSVSETLGERQDKKPYFWKYVTDTEGHENENTKRSKNAIQFCPRKVIAFFSTVYQKGDCVNDSILNRNAGPLRGR